MKKVIDEILVHAETDINILNQKLADTVGTWQSDGYEVDVQISSTDSYICVLLTKYKMI